MKILIDKEINLKDGDLLKTKTYADTLKHLIAQSPTDTAFTIGLFGEWGSGKSSIIKTLKDDLSEEDPAVKFIVYDSWTYANDSFRRTFVKHLHGQLGLDQSHLLNHCYSSKTIDEGFILFHGPVPYMP